MSRLTADRFADAEPILARYLDKLRRDRFFSAFALERELADVWRLGVRELNGPVVDLLGDENYRLVAAYYMENAGDDVGGPLGAALPGTGVDSAFRAPLAALYGASSYDVSNLEELRSAFWRRAFDGNEGVSLPEEQYEGPQFAAHDAAGNEYVLTPVYRCRTDGSGRRAGGDGYEPGDLAELLSTTGCRVRRDGPGRYAVLDSRAGGETLLTSRHPRAV